MISIHCNDKHHCSTLQNSIFTQVTFVKHHAHANQKPRIASVIHFLVINFPYGSIIGKLLCLHQVLSSCHCCLLPANLQASIKIHAISVLTSNLVTTNMHTVENGVIVCVDVGISVISMLNDDVVESVDRIQTKVMKSKMN